jgi:phospholipase C
MQAAPRGLPVPSTSTSTPTPTPKTFLRREKQPQLQNRFLNPNNGFKGLSDGFVRVNDVTEQLDGGVENPTDDQTMAFYNQNEIPFYYDLAQKFAIDDRYFASVLGPTFPNRS